MKKQSGFTLIELMIVVAIIAILAAIALPAYQNYTREARYSELQTTADGLKTAIAVCYAKKGDLTQCGTFGALNLAAFSATDNMSSGADATTFTSVTATGITIYIAGTTTTGSKNCTVVGTVNGTSGAIDWNFDACSYDYVAPAAKS